jgi:putative tryptophan/tyrosine transport system substrate-binding protein
VSLIAVLGSAAAALAAKAATQTIPIAFAVPEDPVKLGLVASLPRPGGNATGINFFTAEVMAKRLGLLRELVPAAARIAVLVNPANVGRGALTRAELEPAARVLGLQVQFYDASTNPEIDAAYATLVRERPDALFVSSDTFFTSRRVQLVSLAARHALPAAYSVRECVEAGGLMSYGTSLSEAFRQVGVYSGRILKGEKPADLPVMQASKFELIINLQTVKLLGLTVPPTLLASADDVIE